MKSITTIMVDPKKWLEFKKYCVVKGTTMSAQLDKYLSHQLDNQTIDEFTKIEDLTNPRLYTEIPEIKDYLQSIKDDKNKVNVLGWKLDEWKGFLKEL